MQLDESTSLVPTNMKASPFGDKKVRALVNYTIDERSYGGNQQSVYVNWIDSIRTKQPVMTQGSEEKNAKAFGNDPIEIVRDWVSVAGPISELLNKSRSLRSVRDIACGRDVGFELGRVALGFLSRMPRGSLRPNVPYRYC